MWIAALPAGLQVLSSLLSFGGEPEASTDKVKPEESAATLRDDDLRRDDLRRLAEQYDLRNISPRELGDFVRDLKSTGAIDSQALRDLSLLPLDEELAGYDQDRQLDLLSLITRKLEQLEARQQFHASADQPQRAAADLETTRRQMEWMRKFQQLGEIAPVDLAA